MDEVLTPLLPVLTDAELRTIFRDDERALWRYHLLSAVFHDGRSNREVAEQFVTTPETVRHLCNSFLETGHLDSLRSKRRGAIGHLQRQSPLAQAIARELALDPEASGGQIWRAVRAQLESSGIPVPRRSVYRLVERLRPEVEVEEAEEESELWAPALVPLLRTALPLLTFDPPLDLGRSQLAEQALPADDDSAMRGKILRDLLRDGLDELRPRAQDEQDDPYFRPYQILSREALEGATREELERDLAIAPATYTRAKRQGLERLAEIVVQKLQERKLPQRAEPPLPPPLFGRDREVAYYTRRLEEEGVAVIWGLYGSGKTALAATIAARYHPIVKGVVWHKCAGAGDGILIGVLRSYGVDRHPNAADTRVLLADIRESSTNTDLLVLECFEAIAHDPAADLLLATLRGATRNGMRLLVLSRVLPRWAGDHGWAPLGGVPDDIARALWAVFGGPAIAPPAWSELYNRTLGYPRLIQALAADVDADIDHLLLDGLCKGLSLEARDLLFRLLLVPQPIRTGEAGGVRVALNELIAYGLVTVGPSRTSGYLHGLIEAHRAGLRVLVPEATRIYLDHADDATRDGLWFDAATFYSAAGEPARAAQVVGEHSHWIVAERQGRAAIDLLRDLLPRLAPGPELAEAQASLGTLYLLVGECGQAIDTLRAVIDLMVAFRETLALPQLRRCHRQLAAAYLLAGRWPEALDHAQVSMGAERTIGPPVSAEERIELTLLQQRIWLLAGRGDQARFWLADAQMLLQITPTPYVAALVAYGEGLDAAHRGTASLAAERLRQALDRLPAATHHGLRYAVVAQLVGALATGGRFDEAIATLHPYLVEAQSLRHRAGATALVLALANVELDRGDIGAARAAATSAELSRDAADLILQCELSLLRASLAIYDGDTLNALRELEAVVGLAADPFLPYMQARANIGLALLYLQQGDATTAAQYALRGLRVAESSGLRRLQAMAHLCLTEDALRRHAWDEVQGNLAQASEIPDDPTLSGMAERAKAELYVAQGNVEAAAQAFRRSLDLLRSGAALARRWAEQSYAAFQAERG